MVRFLELKSKKNKLTMIYKIIFAIVLLLATGFLFWKKKHVTQIELYYANVEDEKHVTRTSIYVIFLLIIWMFFALYIFQNSEWYILFLCLHILCIFFGLVCTIVNKVEVFEMVKDTEITDFEYTYTRVGAWHWFWVIGIFGTLIWHFFYIEG